jgi:hypothetical protein
MYVLNINQDTQKINIKGTKKNLPRSISVIEGTIKESLNENNEITLEKIRLGVVTNKTTLKISYAKYKEKELKILLNLNNIIPLSIGERVRLEFSVIKLSDVSSMESYEKTFKEALFKVKILKGEF